MAWRVTGYEPTGPLGRGSTGQVVGALAPAGTPVAIKYLTGDVYRSPGFAERFREDATLLRSIDHPNLARLYGFVEEHDSAAVISELVDGVSLRAVIAHRGPLAPDVAFFVLRSALLGLGEAHGRGVVHRDLRPENLLITADGVVKVVDIGIASPRSRGGAGGDPSYLAPELWQGAPPTAMSDVYAGAAVLFECITGHPPTGADGGYLGRSTDIAAAIAAADEVPHQVQVLMTVGLAVDPRSRPANADVLLEQLELVAASAFGRSADWVGSGREGLRRRMAAVLDGPAGAGRHVAGPLVALAGLPGRVVGRLGMIGKVADPSSRRRGTPGGTPAGGGSSGGASPDGAWAGGVSSGGASPDGDSADGLSRGGASRDGAWAGGVSLGVATAGAASPGVASPGAALADGAATAGASAAVGSMPGVPPGGASGGGAFADNGSADGSPPDRASANNPSAGAAWAGGASAGGASAGGASPNASRRTRIAVAVGVAVLIIAGAVAIVTGALAPPGSPPVTAAGSPLPMAGSGPTVPAPSANPADAVAPSQPAGLRVVGRAHDAITLDWTPATDDLAVVGYVVTRDGHSAGTAGSPGFTDIGLTPLTRYEFTVTAFDAAGNLSPASVMVAATTLGEPDHSPPSTPGQPHSTAQTATTISLAWAPAVDESGVAGYDIYRDGGLVGSTTKATFTDIGLTPATGYHYAVRAYDTSHNASGLTAPVLVTTGAAGPSPTPPPSTSTPVVQSLTLTATDAPDCHVSVAAVVTVSGPMSVTITYSIGATTGSTSATFAAAGPHTVELGTGDSSVDGTASAQVGGESAQTQWTVPEGCAPVPAP